MTMNRTYNNKQSNSVSFFTGLEVENTPALGLSTLFVVGTHPIDKINENLKTNIDHIFFGANHSFEISTAESAAAWEIMIDHFVNSDRLITLDFDISLVDFVLETGWCEKNNFIPLVSAKIPYVEQLGYNAVLKIDDVDFDRSNPGVWCHHLRGLQSIGAFTPWRAYRKDHAL